MGQKSSSAVKTQIKYAKIYKHRVILTQTKLDNRKTSRAKKHLISSKPLRSNTKKTSKGVRGEINKEGSSTYSEGGSTYREGDST